MNFPKKLQQKLFNRKKNKALRNLGENINLIDFSSNDYLGFAKNESLFLEAHKFLLKKNSKSNGATGSRLLSGNYPLYTEVETFIAKTHNVESALIFNSGYNANIGFFSSVPQRNDLILYDEFIHASIRDGIQLSNAKAYKYKHNNLKDLESKIVLLKPSESKEIYVVTESVFSMDGDSPDLEKMVNICKKNKALLIVDEAHSLGVFGTGLVEELHLHNDVFARIITFGKALGCHGAAILGSKELYHYLINFARSFIYTTGLPPHALATIKCAYNKLVNKDKNQIKLQHKIHHFNKEIKRLQLNFIASCSSIHCIIIGGNTTTKDIALKLKQKGFDIKPILSPTVPKNKERLRICLHSYNSKEEITRVLELLSTFVLK